MPVVIPFDQCIARPAEGAARPQLLKEHLLQVGIKWALSDRNFNGHEVTDQGLCQRLLLLGGLLHDAGKARTSWQRYIKSAQNSHRGQVFHAPAGAALFFYASKRLLEVCIKEGAISENQCRSVETSLLRVGITLDITGHHGRIRDIEGSVPWEGLLSPDHLNEIDLDGLFTFIASRMSTPMAKLIPEEALDYIMEQAGSEWLRLSLVTFPRLRQQILRSSERYNEAAKRCLRFRTSGLIMADRLDAAGVDRSYLSSKTSKDAIDRVARFLEEKSASALENGASPELIDMRKAAQTYAVSSYLEHPSEGVYCLNLPTGLGKTVASLQIALTACAHGAVERIVYVAPYISILSQATAEIRAATGLEVIQHHHLSVLSELDKPEDTYLLTLESWQAKRNSEKVNRNTISSQNPRLDVKSPVTETSFA
jgi:CRISPR-associated endonuclease/helicase Cas3